MHNDIKPGNFLFGQNEKKEFSGKLIDLGLAASEVEHKTTFKVGEVAHTGTRGYRPLDILLGVRPWSTGKLKLPFIHSCWVT